MSIGFTSPDEGKWTFKNKDIANKFDKHVREQLPWYDLTSRAIRHFANHYITKNGLVYDIGAATGNIGVILDDVITARKANLIAIEPSAQMAQKYQGGGKLIVSTAQDVHYEPYEFAVRHLTMMFLAKHERKKVIERLKENRKEGGALVFLEKIIPSGGYFSTVSMRMTLSEKLNAGASCEEIIKKELSLAGIQVPLSEEELEGATKWFCFGDFAGFIYSE